MFYKTRPLRPLPSSWSPSYDHCSCYVFCVVPTACPSQLLGPHIVRKYAPLISMSGDEDIMYVDACRCRLTSNMMFSLLSKRAELLRNFVVLTRAQQLLASPSYEVNQFSPLTNASHHFNQQTKTRAEFKMNSFVRAHLFISV
jgi:hypothetical protein